MTTNPADLIKPPVVVPRDDSHDKFVTTLKQAGYGVIHKALTRTVELPDADRLSEADLWQADWLVVTSKTTVGLLPDPLPNPDIKVAAVGQLLRGPWRSAVLASTSCRRTTAEPVWSPNGRVVPRTSYSRSRNWPPTPSPKD